MNRQLKFRVWDNEQKKFEYFELHNITVPDRLLTQDKSPLQQYTGIKDSEQIDIYEGDIVRGKFFDTDYRHLKTINSEVVWIERYACFNIGIEEWRYSGEPVTIIGNIFENSELLNNEN